jgi:heterodisulfide reductase subunit C
VRLRGRENLWAQAIWGDTGIRAAACYQCLRCTNSCPVASFMDVKPHQVVRLVQFGERERLLACSAVWVCLSCEMCSTYCPNEIDVAGLMNHVKNQVIASRRPPAEKEIARFHRVFLAVLRRHGRINDIQLMQRYRLQAAIHGELPGREELRSELALAVELFKRGRLRLLPERSGAVGEIRRILPPPESQGGLV